MMAHDSHHITFVADYKEPIFLHTHPSHIIDMTPSPISRPTSNASSSRSDPAPLSEAEQRVRQTITAAGSRNADLLSELASTAHAPVQYADAQKRSEFLEERLKEQKKEVKLHTNVAELQLKRHKKFRDSFTKRLSYTVLRKKDNFVEKAQKEEEAYHSALGKRHRAEAQLAELEATKNILLEESTALEALYHRHGEAHKAIDSLYSSLFDGPTPGFPDEDVQEDRHQRAKAEHEARTAELKSITKSVKAAGMLKVAIERAMFEQNRASLEARSRLTTYSYVESIFMRCAKYAARGLELSQQAMEGIPPYILDSNIMQIKTTLNRALRSVVELGTPRRGQRPDGRTIAEKMGASLNTALAQQGIFLSAVKECSAIAREAIRGTARSLEDERQGLQEQRQGAFETTVGFGAAAPAYHECCDRAGWFEGDADMECSRIGDPVVEELPDAPPPEYVYETPDEIGRRRDMIHA